MQDSLSVNDAIGIYRSRGFDYNDISERMKKRGVDILALESGDTKIKMTVGEFTLALGGAKADPVKARRALRQRGIFNIANITDDQFEIALPPLQASAADEELEAQYEKDFNEGLYDNWQWDSNVKNQREKAIQASIEKQTGVDYKKVQEALNEPHFYPALNVNSNDPNRAYAARLTSARAELADIKRTAEWTGAGLAAVTFASDLMGIKPGTRAAQALMNASFQKSDIAKEGLFKDTEGGRALLKASEETLREHVQHYNDISNKEPITLDSNSLEAAFGKVSANGVIKQKGYARGTNSIQNQLIDRIQHALKIRKRLEKERTYESFAEWIDASLDQAGMEGFTFRLDTANTARLARQQLDKQIRQRLKTSPSLGKRSLEEMYEIAQGLFSLAGYVGTGGLNESGIENVADLVASGKLSKDEARTMVEQFGLKQGSGLMGGLGGYLMAYGDFETFAAQAKTEPVSAMLALLPALTLLKAAKVGTAAKAYKKFSKTLKEAGVDDNLIMEASDFSKHLANKKEVGMLRDWLDTARGRNSQSALLKAADVLGVPEIITGASKFAVPGLLLGGEGDAAFYAKLGAGLGAARASIRPSGLIGSRAMRWMDDLAAQSNEAGAIVTNDIQAHLEEGRGLVSALKIQFENAVNSGRDVKAEDFGLKIDDSGDFVLTENAIDAEAATDFLARMRVHVDTNPEVLAAEALYESIPLGNDRIAARQEMLAVRRKALVDFVEGDGTPENPGASWIEKSHDFEAANTAIKDREARKVDREAEIAEITKQKNERLEVMRDDAVPQTEQDVFRATERLEDADAAYKEVKAQAEKTRDRNLELAERQRDRQYNGIDRALKERQEKTKAVGRRQTRAKVYKAAAAELEAATEAKRIADKKLAKQRRDYVKKKRAEYNKRRKQFGKSARMPKFNVRAAEAEFNRSPAFKSVNDPLQKKLDKADEAFRKAEDEYKTPGIIVKGKKTSYVEARQKVDQDYAEQVRNIEKQYYGHGKRETAAIMDAIEDLNIAERRAREAVESRVMPDADTTAPTEIARLEEASAYDRQIENLRKLDAEDQAETALVLDRLTKAKAAQYYRAIDAAFGLHVRDKDYVLDLDVSTTLDRRTQRMLAVDPDPDKPNVTLPNGRTGTSRNTTLATGNILLRAMAFPSKEIAPVIEALNAVVTFAADGMRAVDKEDVTRAAGNTGLQKKAGSSFNDAVKALDQKYRGKKWSEKALSAITQGRLNDRGINDLKRVLLEVYGDIIMNESTRRVLVSPEARREFIDYARGIITDRWGIDPKNLSKDRLNQINMDLNGQAMDFAQGRTVDGFGTYARVSYTFLDPDGNVLKFVSKNGDEVPLTMENIFRDWAEHTALPRTMERARKQALSDTLFMTTRMAETRVASDMAILEATGITRKVWDRGARDPLYMSSIFKYFLENGELPPAFRIARMDDNSNRILTNPAESPLARTVLESLMSTNANRLGLTIEEAIQQISEGIMAANQPGAKNQQRAYVRIGSSEDPSNLPGISGQIGGSPYESGKIGLHSIHAPVQPEHLSDLPAAVRGTMAQGAGSDILIRREFADSLGFMLDSHRQLQMDKKIWTNARAFNALFKWFKTAGSMLNPMTNFVSNIKTFMINQGMNPARAWYQPMYTAALWSSYRAGKLEGTATGARLDALMRTGFADQSQLVAEIDKSLQALRVGGGDTSWVQPLEDLVQAGRVGGKDIPGVATGLKAATEFQNRLYRQFGDELFKVTDALIEWDKIDRRLNAMPKGTTVGFTDLDTGAGIANAKMIGSITRLDEGYAIVLKSGRNKDKVIRVDSLDDKQVSDLIGKAAIGHANSLFYNLTKSGAGIKFAKELESFAMRPFVSWRTKALDIPMVKKGMFYRMFGDDSYMVSDSLKLNLMMYAEQAQREARRVFWLQVAKSQEGNQDHNALRKFLPSWARRAVITGTGADRKLFMAESSNPIGGITTAFEWLLDMENAFRSDPTSVGERSFWANVTGEKGLAPNIQSTVKELFSGGSVTQLVYAFAGWNDMTGKYASKKQEYIEGIAKTIMPNYWLRLGGLDALSAVTDQFGFPLLDEPTSMVGKMLSEAEAVVDFDPKMSGKRSTQKLLRVNENGVDLFGVDTGIVMGDTVVTGVTNLLARKYRRLDPIWLTRLVSNFPSRLRKQIIEIGRQNKLKGYDFTSEKTQNQIQPLINSAYAFERHTVRMVEALSQNGVDPVALKQLNKSIEKKKKEWERARLSD